MSGFSVYAATKMCESEEEIFYAKLDSILDHCPCRDAAIGTERAGHELCIGCHGSGIRNDKSSFLLNLARSKRLRVVGSYIKDQRHIAGFHIEMQEGH